MTSIKSIIVIFKKEIKQYFSSPIAYLLIFFFSLFTSLWLFLFQSFFAAGQADLRGFFGIMPIIFILLVPAVTMRTWAEEQKSGSIQLLQTLPFTEWDLVLGKYFGAMFLFLVMMVLSVAVPLSLLPFGHFEIGVIFGNYLGLFLIIAAEVSIGCFLSAMTKNQISNFLLSTIILLVLTIIGYLPNLTSLPRFLGASIQYIAITTHYNSFVKGLIDTRDLVFYACFIAVFLFLNRQILLYRKWR